MSAEDMTRKWIWKRMKMGLHLALSTQRSAKICAPGLVNSVPAVAYYFCLALPAAFTQPGVHLLAEPCTRRRCRCNIICIFAWALPFCKNHVTLLRQQFTETISALSRRKDSATEASSAGGRLGGRRAVYETFWMVLATPTTDWEWERRGREMPRYSDNTSWNESLFNRALADGITILQIDV